MKKFFKFSKWSTSYEQEILAGITTFLAAMYIIIVNPSIMVATGMPFSGVLTATVLVSTISSIFMGIYAKNPIVVAPGMGINAFFTYSVVLGMGVKWEVALGAVFWSGVIFLGLSIFNVRTKIVKAIPSQIRYGIAAGIGLFITFIGLKNGGFIVANKSTLISRGEINSQTMIFILGFIVTAILVAKRTKGAMILGIIVTTILSWMNGRYFGENILVTYSGIFQAPDFSLIFKLDFIESIKFSFWPVVFVFLFTDMFDSISTFVGVAESGNLKDSNGQPKNIKQSMIVDGFSTLISGLLGTSSGTSYIESAAGIEEGGRTGLVAIVCGILFLPFMFLSPLLSMIPAMATAPVLVLVGTYMIRPVTKIHWNRLDDAIPAFMAIVLIPLTFSITQGIIWSFLTFFLLKLFCGKWKEISVTLVIINIFAILSLFAH